ncbi:bestrophin, partial [Acinetobacter sp. FNA3]
MIIRDKSNIFQILFAWQGTVLPKVLPELIGLMLISTIIGFLAYYQIVHIPQVPAIGFTIFGIILSIFLGFRNNTCYARWWEGRKLWGSLIASSRHIDRDSKVLSHIRRERVLNHVMVFSSTLRDRLRHQTANLEQFIGTVELDEQSI